MAGIFGIDLSKLDKSNKELIKFLQSAALYNYMQMFLSNGFDELKAKYDNGDLRTIELLSHLQMKNIQMEFKDDGINKNIENEVVGITKTLDELINNYKNLKDESMKSNILQIIDEKIKDFSDKMLGKLAYRNIEALRCIRNSIDHAGFKPQDNGVELIDAEDKTLLTNNNQNADQRVFTCNGKIETFFEITKSIETETKSPGFEMFDELKSIVPEVVYKDFEESIKRVQGIKLSGLLKYQIAKKSR